MPTKMRATTSPTVQPICLARSGLEDPSPSLNKANRFRNACLIGTALGGSLLFTTAAYGQAFNASPVIVDGTVSFNRANPLGAGTEVVTTDSPGVLEGNQRTKIRWIPLPGTFLPAGNSALFQSTNFKFTLLNRIDPTGAPVTMDGDVRTQVTFGGLTGISGRVVFEASEGLVVGSTATFSVGDLGFEGPTAGGTPGLNGTTNFVDWNGQLTASSTGPLAGAHDPIYFTPTVRLITGNGLRLDRVDFSANGGFLNGDSGTRLALEDSVFRLRDTALNLPTVDMIRSIFMFDGGAANSTRSLTQSFTLNEVETIQTEGSRTLTLSGPIGGAGSLTIAGTGTTVLSGTNTYAGGTTINSGTLSVSADSNLGDAAGSLVLNGGTLQSTGTFSTGRNVSVNSNSTVDVTGVNNLTMTGILSGANTLTKTGSGTLTFGPALNTAGYTGGMTVSGGALSLQGNLGAGFGTITTTGSVIDFGNGVDIAAPININSNTTQLQVLSGTATQSGVISETGGSRPLEKIGAGTLTLTGINTYTGTTTITSGTLALSGSGWVGFSSGIVANGTFSISDSLFPFVGIQALSGSGAVTLGTNGLFIAAASGEFSGMISGSGGLEIGGGTQTLSGVNTYTNLTQIDAGATLALKGAGSIASSAGVSFFGAGTFDISQTTSGATVSSLASPSSTASVRLGGQTLTITNGSVFSGVISDGGIAGGTGGGLTIANGASQELSGVNTYTGATTINAGGELLLANNGSITPSGVIADGIFDISQLNVATTIRSLTGATTGQVFLGANGLTVSNASGIFAGVIADGGFNGGAGGTLALTGGSLNLTGTNTYTGATTVNGGTLAVNGSIATSAMTTVNTGATLGGTGTVGNTTVAAGGFLAPGNSIGTLNVQGNLTLAAAASYMVEVDPASADRTNVTGTANLGGATVNATFAPGSYVSRQYTILTANGGLGGSTFGTLVNTNLPTAFASSLSHDANNAYLNIVMLTPNFGKGLNINQTNVANALVNSFNAAGGIPLVFGALTPQGLTQVSGEGATGSQQTTFDAMGQFVNVLTDPFMGTRSGGAAQGGGASSYAGEDQALAYAAKRKRNPNDALAAIHTKAPIRATIMERLWSVWGAGYGGTRSTDGNAAIGSNDTRSRVYGAAAGVDYRLTPNTIVGFSLGGAGTNFNVAGGLGNGRSEMFQAGLYGRHMMGAAYLSGALAYGWQDVTTDRNVFGNAYRANFNADALSARIEGGWRFATSATSGLTPYAAGQVTSFFLPNYNEQTMGGVNTFALSYAQKDVTASRSELGLRGDTSFAMQDAILTLRGRAAWAHNFDTDRSINAIFQTLPASGFTVNGATQARNAALLSAGGEIRWASGFSIAGTFEGEFSRNADSYAGKGIVRYQW